MFQRYKEAGRNGGRTTEFRVCVFCECYEVKRSKFLLQGVRLPSRMVFHYWNGAVDLVHVAIVAYPNILVRN